MSKNKKIIIGILTCLPIVFFVLYMVSIFSMVGQLHELDNTGQMNRPEDVMSVFGPMFLYIGLMAITGLAMLIYYIIDIVNNPKFQGPGNNKLIWILVVIFGGMIGMIVYFFVEIYPRPELPPMPPNA